jgi:exonuclease III
VPADDDTTLEIHTLWQPDPSGASSLHVSVVHNVARLITVNERSTIIRLITPQHTWAHSLPHDDPTLTHDEAEPTPLARLPAFADSLFLSSVSKEQTEIRLLTQHLLCKVAGGEEHRGTFHVQYIAYESSLNSTTPLSYYGKATRRDEHMTCPGCQDDNCPPRDVHFTICSHFQSFTVTCPRTGSTRSARLGDAFARQLFGQAAAPTRQQRPPLAMPQINATDQAPYPAAHERPAPRTTTLAGKSHSLRSECGLTIAQLNFDRTGKKALPQLLAYADKHSIDVLLLQDVENCNWSQLALLDRGWAYHYHRKCAILLRTNTAQRLVGRLPSDKGGKKPSIWRSPSYNSIGITLLTPDGTLFLASSYLPPGIDQLPSDPDDPVRRTIEAQHKEMAVMAAHHDHSALVFDGNETITTRGRIQLLTDESTRLSGSKRNAILEVSTMGCHAATMVDAHRYLHDKDNGSYPALADMTNTMQGQRAEGIREVRAKLDYTLLSSSLCSRLSTCEINHEPRHWTGGNTQRANYHASIITHLRWSGLWRTEDTKGPTSLAGSALHDYPNYSRMTAHRAAKISKNTSNERCP